jgi:hypothetical protein
MPGVGKCRLRTAVVIAAFAACALAPSLAPALVRDGKEKPRGAIGVKGVAQASPGFAEARPTMPGKSAPLATDSPTGLEARVGSLPFTGWDLIILGGVAFVLTGTGFTLHRLSMPRTPNL